MNEPKKQTGILDRLSPEEREALREVCALAEVMLQFHTALGGDAKRRDTHSKAINQLLGEEK